MRKKEQVAQLPAEWQQRFKSSSVKVGFQLNLSRSMLEFLCAVADNVQWDRATFGELHYPDNWIATESSLEKRGLVERKSESERRAVCDRNGEEIKRTIGRRDEAVYQNYCRLTPAGEAVIGLLKISGLFIEQDAAMRRKHRA